MNRLAGIVFTTLLAIILTSGFILYAVHSRAPRTPAPAAAVAPDVASAVMVNAPMTADAKPAAETQSAQVAPVAANTDRSVSSLFTEILMPTSSTASSAQGASFDVIGITLRFAFAAMLAALLAFRPRRGVPVHRRNPFVAQTQVLLAVVAAAMMIIVGDSAARAFGIFAAASLVSFRTNIRDPKDIAVLLVCLGIGLGAGVGRMDLAIVLSLFVLVTLTMLEFMEQRQAFRSMEVCVETRDIDRTQEVLKGIFNKQGFRTELRELERECEDDPMGKVTYHVNLSPVTDMDRLSEQIIAADRDNIGSVEWEQKKSMTYNYN